MWQGLLHSSGDTVHSDERHCGLRTCSDGWTWSLVWLVFLLLASSLRRAQIKHVYPSTSRLNFNISNIYNGWLKCLIWVVCMFLLTFQALWHLVNVNRAGRPEFRVPWVRVKGQLSNILNVRPLGIYRSCNLGYFWR